MTEIDAWIETAGQATANAQWYRGLLVQIGEQLGEAAKTCDDGSKSEDVLVAKVPELVAARLAFPKAELLGAIARGWCSPANEKKEMDSDLAEAIAAEVWHLLGRDS